MEEGQIVPAGLMATNISLRDQESNELRHGRLAGSSIPAQQIYVLDEGFDAISYLEWLRRDLVRLRTAGGVVTKTVTLATGKEALDLDPLGNALKQACIDAEVFDMAAAGGRAWSRIRQHQFHPYIKAFFDRYLGCRESLLHVLDEGGREEVARFIAHMASKLVEDFEDPAVKARIKTLRARGYKKFERALAYARGWFTMCSRPLLIRLDLYIREDGSRWCYSNEAWSAFDVFCKSLARGQIIGEVLGWMAARDDGVIRGIHYHVIVALDGHDHRAGVYYARKLGEFWKSRCVGAKAVATYFNCFSKRHQYRYPAVGVIRAGDPVGVAGLYYAIRYLCKEDDLVVTTEASPRNFRRGVDRKPSGGMGAPRRVDPDQTLVRSILSTKFNAKKHPEFSASG